MIELLADEFMIHHMGDGKPEDDMKSVTGLRASGRMGAVHYSH